MLPKDQLLPAPPPPIPVNPLLAPRSLKDHDFYFLSRGACGVILWNQHAICAGCTDCVVTPFDV